MAMLVYEITISDLKYFKNFLTLLHQQ